MSDERLSEERLHALDVWAETASYSLALDVRDLIAEARRARRLEAAIEDYSLWRPCEKGHAAAHRRLFVALAEDEEPGA